MAPRSPAHLSGSRTPKPGPRLSDAIHAGPMRFTKWEIIQDVISPNDYSMTIHERSKPHVIRPKTAKALKFYWRKRRRLRSGGSRRFRPSEASYFDQVRHPGNRRPVKFLTVPLKTAAQLHGFKTFGR